MEQPLQVTGSSPEPGTADSAEFDVQDAREAQDLHESARVIRGILAGAGRTPWGVTSGVLLLPPSRRARYRRTAA